jgi:hypothetical protein
MVAERKCREDSKLMRRFVASLSALALSTGLVLVPHAFAQGHAKPSLTVVSPSNGDTVTSTDIPVQVQVSKFTLSAAAVGMPDKEGEGHIHVMLGGMNMGVLSTSTRRRISRCRVSASSPACTR